ncbi:recombinase family protein [Nocardia tengchongensis]|uniref:recombinase family protein n=1 Tax=Nocardia tengchongensis TaxID=2055889 RepID=UPI0036151775
MGEPFRVGYCRCSTDEQDVEIQTDQVLALAVPRERIFIDKGFSGTTRKNRIGLDNALAAVTSAAAAITGRQVVLTTTKFDRFARNMAEAGEILTSLRERDVLFGLGASIYDWHDPFGRLFLQTLAMVAEFEANLNHLRTREGTAKARAKGRLKGNSRNCLSQHAKRSTAATTTPPTTRVWPTSPRNTASAGPPSTASSAAPCHGHSACGVHVPGAPHPKPPDIPLVKPLSLYSARLLPEPLAGGRCVIACAGCWPRRTTPAAGTPIGRDARFLTGAYATSGASEAALQRNERLAELRHAKPVGGHSITRPNRG